MVENYKQLKAEKQEEREFFDREFQKLKENFENDKTWFKMSSKQRKELPMGRPNSYKIDEEKYLGITPSTNIDLNIRKLENVKRQFKLLNICLEDINYNKSVIENNTEKIGFADLYISKVKQNQTAEFQYAINKLVADSEDLIYRFRCSQYAIDEAFNNCMFERKIQKDVEDYPYDL